MTGAGTTPLWRTQRERGSLLLMAALARVALTCGRGVARMFLPPIVLYFIATGAAARRASRRYLGRVLGRPARLPDVARHYHAFATTILDRVFWLAGRVDAYRPDLCGAESVLAALRAGGGCLLVGAHFGSFELTRVLAREIPGVTVDVLMRTDNARKIAAALARINPAAGVGIIELGTPGTMLAVRDALRAGHAVGLLADRSLVGDDTLRVPFLGDDAAFPRGPFKLAVALDVPVVLFHSVWRGGCDYDVVFEPISVPRTASGAPDVDAMVRAYAGWLAAACRAAPYNWFNFYDFWAHADAGPR
jgi:predicted LPLAT superfamily acyltransferase